MLSLPKLIGHRGVKNLAPENTLDSIELAHKLGLKWIEVDVKITKDKIPIILHDDSLDRTTNSNGLVIDFLYEEIKALDAGSFFFNYKTNIFIPTLEDIFNFCIKHEMGINIELKPNKISFLCIKFKVLLLRISVENTPSCSCSRLAQTNFN